MLRSMRLIGYLCVCVVCFASTMHIAYSLLMMMMIHFWWKIVIWKKKTSKIERSSTTLSVDACVMLVRIYLWILYQYQLCVLIRILLCWCVCIIATQARKERDQSKEKRNFCRVKFSSQFVRLSGLSCEIPYCILGSYIFLNDLLLLSLFAGNYAEPKLGAL